MAAIACSAEYRAPDDVAGTTYPFPRDESGRRRSASGVSLFFSEVGFGSNSAVPSTTEHSRSTFSCGRTVTLPSRPEVAAPQNRKLELWSAPNRDPIQTALCRGCCSEYRNGGVT